jgi:glycosidase
MNQPTIYELNTPVFLTEIGQRTGYPVTLATVPDQVWDEVAATGADMVWLMGVWTRSPLARTMALSEPWLRGAYEGIADDAIIGSAYSIQAYTVDETLGGNDALAIARAKLKERGVGLLLDYVPNHVAIDHAWVAHHPEFLIRGTEEELNNQPNAFVRTQSGVIAKAKDPNFEPWSDVVQLDAFSRPLRFAVTELLHTLASMCDGVRCDMAMLMMNDVFAQTWGERAGQRPQEDYWPPIITAVKDRNPNFIFLAEVYWGKEQALLEQGFDFCYDKELYDALVHASVPDLEALLHRPLGYQKRLMRFIENHDEPRAAATFELAQHQAAAVIAATLPGMHLYHQGQFEGARVKVPVHLRRRSSEPGDQSIMAFYAWLRGVVSSIQFKTDTWTLLDTQAGFFHHRSKQVVAWAWSGQAETRVIAVNYSAQKAAVRLPYLVDKTIHQVLDGSGNVLNPTGEILNFEPWQVAIMTLS